MSRRKKLIEVALPLPEINDASAYDKMPGIGPHPKGIHHWWARLPLPTARAILFASAVDDPGEHPEKFPTSPQQDAERERLFGIIRRLMSKQLHKSPEVYAEALAEIRSHCDGVLPVVFDPFSGGGSIPLEASRLGFPARAADLNPVAVLLNKCNLELAPAWHGRSPVNPDDRLNVRDKSFWPGTMGLAADIRYYASVVRRGAEALLGRYYPATTAQDGKSLKVVAWIWARTVASPNPGAKGQHVPLISSFVLATGEKKAWLHPVLDSKAPHGWRCEVRTGPLPSAEEAQVKLGTKAGKAQDFICLLTKTPIPRSYIQAEGKAGRLRTRLVAVIADAGKGKTYLAPTAEQEVRVSDPRLEDARKTFLSGPLPTRAEITGGVCTAYGLNTWGHLFHDRQLLGLLTLSDLVRELSQAIEKDFVASGGAQAEAGAYARTVVTFLSLAIDRCADFNNALCRWSASNQKVMNLFARQALPMVFDSAEANLLGDAVGAWSTCSGYVADCVEVLTAGANARGSALQSDAAGSRALGERLLVSTDPPYYDNISYGTLSDFFYVWLRRGLSTAYPDLFGTVLTPKLPELIASPDRFGGSKEGAREHFESGFRRAFSSLRQVMDERFPLTVYYAFKQEDEKGAEDPGDSEASVVDLTTGWETLLEALIASGFCITATWPVRASQKWRMVSMGTNALASYIVLACRPLEAGASQSDRRSFISELKRELPEALHHLQQGNIAPVDFAQASIGPGMAIFSRHSRVLEADGSAMTVRSALHLINTILDEYLSAGEGETDPETRFAVSWFEANGWNAGSFGDAETLAKARNVSVSTMVEAGIAASAAGKVRLVPREELGGLEGARRRKVTIWEGTQLLLKELNSSGEQGAAAVVKELGDLADPCRTLAYRLHGICERKSWVDEARALNGLVMAWPELVRLEATVTASPGTGGQLGFALDASSTSRKPSSARRKKKDS